MGLIYDPFDETQALHEDGRLAARAFFIPGIENVHAPTASELKDAGIFAGWVDFNLSGLDKPDDETA